MRWIDEDGTLHIELSEAAEEILDIFNRAQAGELEPFAKYIEDGKPITPEMRLFLGAFLRRKLNWGRGPNIDFDKLKERNYRLNCLRKIREERGLTRETAIGELATELDMSEATLESQIRKAEQEEKGPFHVGPSYRDD